MLQFILVTNICSLVRDLIHCFFFENKQHRGCNWLHLFIAVITFIYRLANFPGGRLSVFWWRNFHFHSNIFVYQSPVILLRPSRETAQNFITSSFYRMNQFSSYFRFIYGTSIRKRIQSYTSCFSFFRQISKPPSAEYKLKLSVFHDYWNMDVYKSWLHH